jgi:hypothetical protein
MKVGIFHGFLFLFLAFLLLESLFEPLRYLKYTLPFMAFILYFFIDKAKLDYKYFLYLKTFLIFYLFLIIYLLFKVLFLNEFQGRFLANAGFILLPISFLLFISPFFKREEIKCYVKSAFFVTVFIFILREADNIFLIFSNVGLLKQAFISSTIKTENHLAYASGIFLFYFITERYPKKYIITCAIIFILSFKRIAIGAFIISYLYYFLSEKFFKFKIEKYRQIFTMIGVVANLLFIKLVFLIVNGDIDRTIEKYTGLSANNFLKGRQYLYKIVVNEIGSISWSGVGLGKVDEILFEVFNEKKPLHSDILNNYFEFGVILFFVWLFLLFYKNSFSNKSFSLLIYFNIMMLTDNVFIYFDFMFYFYFFILIYISQTFYKKDVLSLPALKS